MDNSSWGDTNTIVGADNVVYCATSYTAVLYALRDDGTLLWKRPVEAAYFAIGASGTVLTVGDGVPVIALQ